MAVLDIRGTHGSGKSWLMHQLLAQYPNTPLLDKQGHHLGYRLPTLQAVILGKYATACGGCDGIKTADEVARRMKLFAKQYPHVLLEGILVSHTFARYSALASELGDYRFLFLNTPMATCIARVRNRRQKEGNVKPFNTANLIKDWHQIWERTQAKCRAAGHTVIVLQWSEAFTQLLSILKGC